MIGKTLLHYEITAPIGAGGMGEVYRATDTRLGREVAVKVLPADVAESEDRLARFRREARVLAALNHPGIAAIHGLEESEGRLLLVMELVPGEDLSQRLQRGPLPVDEAVEVAGQIAEALEAAHAQGIVHRDLKPANVKRTPDGRVKVLDFGLAKAYAGEAEEDASADLSRSPTLARTGTAAGFIVGTAAYMSPEQARGQSVDERTDIWALGVVLWELLTGKPLFGGETASDVLAEVLKSPIDYGTLPEATPPGVRRLLRRCLERNPRSRLHHAADARIELETSAEEAPGGPERTTRAPRAALLVPAVLAVAAVALAVGRWTGRAAEERADTGSFAFAVSPLGDGPVTIDELALSRDGRRLVYSASEQPGLLLREMGTVGSRIVPGTKGARRPFISPDGEWLGFTVDGKLRKVAFAGGDPVPICDAPEAAPGATWGLDGSIYFSPTYTSGLFRVDANGGTPEAITSPDRARGETGHMWADPLPGGAALVFTVFGGTGMSGSKAALLDLRSGRYEILFEGAGAHYVASGHLVFYRRGVHYAVPFDPASRKVTGEARPVLRDVRPPEPTGSRLQLAFSDTGTVAYVPGAAPVAGRASRLVWVSREGEVVPLPFEAVHRVSDLELSADGESAVVTRYEDGEWQIWTYDLVRGTAEKLTRDGVHLNPAWHPDGVHVSYTSLVEGQYDIWWSTLDGSHPPEALITGPADEGEAVWSADGSSLLFRVYSETTGPDLVISQRRSADEPRPLVVTPLNDSDARPSPDGKWVAYRSGDGLYVSPFPQMGTRTLVTRGGREPRWSASTNELLFVEDLKLMAAHHEIATGVFEAEPARALLDLPGVSGGYPAFDVAPDGARFLLLAPISRERVRDEIHVVSDGFEELTASTREAR